MTKQIPLSDGARGYALVSDEDHEYLSQFKWSLDGSGYPQRAIKTERGWRPLRMHRDILGLVGRQMADHVNGDRLDNQRENLRRCTPTDNIRNRPVNSNNKTGYKGVRFNRGRGCYQAYIMVNWKSKYLGAFANPADAARAYDHAARQYFGPFAWLNFPNELHATAP